MPIVILLALVVIGIVAAVALGAVSLPGSQHTVQGDFLLTDTSTTGGGIDDSGVSCQGDGGYSDIGPGTNVTVKNEKGELLATTTLGTGSGGSTYCEFKFMLTVPDNAKFYTFEVGRRGELSYSHDEMDSSGWSVGASLGS